MSTLAIIAIAALIVLSIAAVLLPRQGGAARSEGTTRQSRLVRLTDGAATATPTRSALVPRTIAATPSQATHPPRDPSQAAADQGYGHGRAGQPYANPYERFRGRRDNPDYLAYYEAYWRGRHERGPATVDTEQLPPRPPRHGHRTRREAFLRSLEDL